ncbi:MAG: PIG-L family deacetylase [Patescibacteria group bacterium]|nr:PIG-L family deacetylase [Patescibacteria group bacterium]MCL5261723.1 PIG-L family deacetylase [Patescibacteria group bacterium]
MFKKNKKYFITAAIIILFIGYSIYVKYIGALPDAIVNFFDEIQAPTASDRVLVFAPHQDDEVLGSGALIIMAKREAAEVKIVIATNGNRTGIEAIRSEETLRAAATMGVGENDVVFWNYPDGKLQNYASSLPSQIRSLIESFRPTIIVTPDPEDGHRDHKILGKAVKSSLAELGYQSRVLGYLVHYHDFPRPLGYAPKRNLLPPINLLGQPHIWNRLSLTPEVEEAKHEAISRYVSQLQKPWLKSLILSFVRRNELFSAL